MTLNDSVKSGVNAERNVLSNTHRDLRKVLTIEYTDNILYLRQFSPGPEQTPT